MRIPDGSSDRQISFVAIDSSDSISRKTGLSSFTVYGSVNGGTPGAFTTPTVTELDSTNMPGCYALLLDEKTSISSAFDVAELLLHITASGMLPVTLRVELYRPKTPEGTALAVDSMGNLDGNVNGNVLGYTNSINGISWPANFADLAISSGTGRVDVGLIEGVDATDQLDAHVGGGGGGDATEANQLTIITALAAIDGIVDAILLDSNELQTDWTNGGRLDLLIDAIKAKSDNLPAAPAATGDIPSASTIAAQVRTELATELARLDVATSTRNATTPPTTTAIASQVRTELATELARIDVATSTRNATIPPTAAAVADAVWDEILSGHSSVGSAGKALTDAGASGDPWSTVVPGSYDDGTAGAAIGRLNNTAASAPVVVIPDAPTNVSMCRVYGYLYRPDGSSAEHAELVATLVVPSTGPAKDDEILTGRTIRVKADSTGLIQLDLKRTDAITPSGCTYSFTCIDAALTLTGKTLTASTLDLATFIS